MSKEIKKMRKEDGESVHLEEAAFCFEFQLDRWVFGMGDVSSCKRFENSSVSVSFVSLFGLFRLLGLSSCTPMERSACVPYV